LHLGWDKRQGKLQQTVFGCTQGFAAVLPPKAKSKLTKPMVRLFKLISCSNECCLQQVDSQHHWANAIWLLQVPAQADLAKETTREGPHSASGGIGLGFCIFQGVLRAKGAKIEGYAFSARRIYTTWRFILLEFCTKFFCNRFQQLQCFNPFLIGPPSPIPPRHRDAA
jgi:hypothetical protein